MRVPINFDNITQLFLSAFEDNRRFLYEYEVYSLLSNSGAETPPKCNLIPKGSRPSNETLTALPGEKTVLKIVSPYIIHKTEAGGVKIVDKETNKILSAMRRMFAEVPENYISWVEKNGTLCPEHYRSLSGEDKIAAVSRDIKGILQVQYMPPDSHAFGNELIVGLRNSREFGTVISAGLGGTDTELYAKCFRKGQAIVAASAAMTDGLSFFQLFKKTISYKKLAGHTRGQQRIVTDDQLIECFESFICLGNYYSEINPDAPFIIKELEINPFSFSDYLMVPLDGLCRFGRPQKRLNARPIKKIDNLLHPETIGIIGVSRTRVNFARIILDNIIAEGFNKDNILILKENTDKINGVKCINSLKELKEKLDLFIVAFGAKHVPDLVDEIIRLDAAHSVMLIPGGMGETIDSKDRAQLVIDKIQSCRHLTKDGGPVFLGANCMGVISKPGTYDTWFIPEQKLPKQRNKTCQKAALISQSGAFMLHRSHQYPYIRPAYMISMGNQTDLTLGDMVHYFKTSDKVDVIAVYAEGFNDNDGLEFCKAVKEAVIAGKEVIFYKAGRTAEGRLATSSHTASLAGDYMVCESCVTQAGAIVARTFSEFQELMFLSETLNRKIVKGNRLAAVSGAGFEAVGMADSILSDDYQMQLAEFEERSIQKIRSILKEKGLDALVTISNPLDINPASDDEIHARIVEVLAQDKGVDAVIVSLDPMSPVTKTLNKPDIPEFDMDHEQGIKNLITGLVKSSDIPIVTIVDGGELYQPLRDLLAENNIPVFSVCDNAVAALSLYIKGRLNTEYISRG
ncbi:CoA-binding domain-containing protein [Desulfonema limicola]|uniref:CoA-binding domain-containing protein n=1 Tax=Desulfonema limicola TaxID=45656 RepID=A0A975B3H2_9BACT|nr:acetate--CoA ligase family protein [Desulfonema limicola]QTA78091.1 CoA-binding domain-containing protein [Desulfonema limicola]